MNDQTNSFFFYDLETSGLSPRESRIMQFAGQRTDLELNPIGEPVNLLVKLSDDTLPSPYAIAVTKITPQSTQADGLTEAELCRYLTDEIFIPGTCVLGYNSVRFDDEFIRHLFWRNFYDPYEWQWKDGRSRWDILDVVRLTRALRPEGINWPYQDKEIEKDGKKETIKVKTNRLELITKLNHIEHEHAHDALADVCATIAVARLIKEKQPDLWDFLFKMRDKKQVAKLVNLEEPVPFVYACGRYSSEYDKTTVAFPVAPSRNGNVLVWDLRYDIAECGEGAFPGNKEISPRETTTLAGSSPRKSAARVRPSVVVSNGREISRPEGCPAPGCLTGYDIFKLQDTYGFPMELSVEEAYRGGIKLSQNWKAEFEQALNEQRERSKTASKGMFKGGLEDHGEMNTKYHTATHLLLAALQKHINRDISQQGSNITSERMRLDYNTDHKLTDEEKALVEDQVNEWIAADLPVIFAEYDKDYAKNELKAHGSFWDRYPEKVKVYTIGDENSPASREVCGGPHVEHTGVLGHFKIQKDESSSAGVRRIKAILE